MDVNVFTPWLQASVAEVLESMCFVATLGEAPEQDPDPDWLSVSLRFEGEPSGSFGVSAPFATSRIIAANLLGEEESEVTHSQAVEVLCEFANMTCGSLLARLDSKQVFTLTSPQGQPMAAHADDGSHTLSRIFELDEGVLQTWLVLKGPQ